ncbi:MAG: NUDIX domain-containing protein [Chloroflexi bacterium]|nr:NUDIX domain-containing protein [Chloroflexota bacterium]
MDAEQTASQVQVVRYRAAGGVIVHPSGRVLVLERPSRREVRLPKGHIDPGETPLQTALREIAEEAGFQNLKILADLGIQDVKFTYQNRPYERQEHYFLFLREGGLVPERPPESQFQPLWLPWEEAEQKLTYAPEREWVRRAHRAWQAQQAA